MGFVGLLCLLAVATNAMGGEPEAAVAPAPSPDAQVSSLEQMCEASADARSERQTTTTLYERLGKDEKIHALTAEIISLHLQNDAIKHFVDPKHADDLAKGVAEFFIAGTGGPQVYGGPSLRASHEHLQLTNADFMSAGADVMQAMKNLGYGQNEIDEVVCILVELRDQVVLAD